MVVLTELGYRKQGPNYVCQVLGDQECSGVQPRGIPLGLWASRVGLMKSTGLENTGS